MIAGIFLSYSNLPVNNKDLVVVLQMGSESKSLNDKLYSTKWAVGTFNRWMKQSILLFHPIQITSGLYIQKRSGTFCVSWFDDTSLGCSRPQQPWSFTFSSIGGCDRSLVCILHHLIAAVQYEWQACFYIMSVGLLLNSSQPAEIVLCKRLSGKEKVACTRYWMWLHLDYCFTCIKLFNDHKYHNRQNYTVMLLLLSHSVIHSQCDHRLWVGLIWVSNFFLCPSILKSVAILLRNSEITNTLCAGLTFSWNPGFQVISRKLST